MKKILASLVLTVLLLGATSALAQTGPQNYCELKVGINWKGNYYANDVETSCLNTNGVIIDNCKVKSGDVVGGYMAKWNADKDLQGTLEQPVDFSTPDWGMICFVNTIGNITNWVFYVMTAIAVLLFVYGGITYMFALGDSEKAGKGSKIIIYAIIGLIIALVAKIVPDIVTTLVK